MPEYDFSGQVAFVTGGARGQGRSHAVAYARHGADVVVTDICESLTTVPYDLSTRADLEETVDLIESHGQDALAIEMDVRDEAVVEAAVADAVDRFGHIDILANNAGVNSSGGLLELNEATWDEMLDTNLKGMWLVSKHVGQQMVEQGGGGKIVNTSSNHAFLTMPNLFPYNAVKAGINGMTRAMALDLGPRIRVNTVNPGWVAIERTMGDMDPDYREQIESIHPVGRLGEPSDIAAAVAFLASDEAGYVTGTNLVVDGGFGMT